MNLTLVSLIFFFMLALIASAVFYYLSLQNLSSIRREVDKLHAQATVARSSTMLRNERARCQQQLAGMEAAILASEPSALNAQEIAQVDATALEIKNCNQALKNAGDWMGLPFDLEWVDMLEKLPRLNALYRASLLDPSPTPLVVLGSEAVGTPQITLTGASR
ncbi:MAG: hypothetical protein WCK81_00570 [Betaproteobacteria bacterium]